MPRPCTICAHPKRADIDAELLGGAALRGIAGRTGTSDSALARHKGKCLPAGAKRAVVAVKEQAKADYQRSTEAHAQTLVARAEEGARMHDEILRMCSELATLLTSGGPGEDALSPETRLKRAGKAVMALDVLVKASAARAAHTKLVGQATGELQTGTKVEINVQALFQLPVWQTLEAVLMEELAKLPGGVDVMRRVSLRLTSGDGNGGRG